MNSIADELARVLRNDVISGSASSWVAAYPTTFSAGASSVPVWFYTCRKDIWAAGVDGGITVTQWEEDYVVSRFGLGDSRPKTVDVSEIRELDQCDWPPSFPNSNTIGALGSEVHIYLKYPDAVPENISTMLELAELRIRRLLDYNVRVNQFGTRMFQLSSPEFTGDCKVYWQGLISNDIKTMFIKYFAFYTRTMLRRPSDDPVT